MYNIRVKGVVKCNPLLITTRHKAIMLAETLSRHKNHTKRSSKNVIPKLNIMQKKKKTICTANTMKQSFKNSFQKQTLGI